MKKTAVVLVMMGLGALLPGHATPAQQASAADSSNHTSNGPGTAGQATRSDGEPSDGRAKWRDISDKKRPSGHSSPTTTNRPQQLANNGRTTRFGNAVHNQPGSTNPGGALMGGSIENKQARYAPPIRASSVTSLGSASLHAARHRGPNPAVIGGWGNSTGTLDGTRMNRKP